MELRVGALEIYTRSEGTPNDNLERVIGDTVRYNRLDILVAPNFLFNRTDRPYTKREKDELVKSLKALTSVNDGTRRKRTLLFPGTIVWKQGRSRHNSTPMLWAGRQWGEYSYQNTESKNVFKHKGINIGMEIGDDHTQGVLKDGWEEVDLHILLSNSTEIEEPKIMARDGGYFINCDGGGAKLKSFKERRVWRILRCPS